MFGVGMLAGRLGGATAMMVLIFGLWSGAAAPAAADFNRPPRAEGREVAAIEERRRSLFARMLEDPGNLDAAFEYAALSSQVGDLEGAIATLERMLIFAPGLPRLQLELGVLYFRLGAHRTADTYFEAALASGKAPPEVREKVALYQQAIARGEEVAHFSGAVSAGLRYQTNANNAPSSAFVTLNGLDYLLSNDARKTPDLNGFLTGDLQGVFDLPAQGVRFKTALRTYGELYRERNDLNLGYGELSAGPSFDLNRFGLAGYSLDLYGIAGGGFMAGEPLMSSFGAGALLGVRPNDDFFYGLRGEYRRETFYNSPAHPNLRDKSGDRLQGQLISTYRLTNRLNLGLAGILDRFSAREARNSYWQFGGVAGFSLDFASPVAALPDPWNFSVSTQLSRRLHDRADTMISRQAQETVKWTVNVTQTIPLAKSWAALVQASYQKAWSNYDTGTFGNATIAIGLKKVF